jgi:hypothetical protein
MLALLFDRAHQAHDAVAAGRGSPTNSGARCSAVRRSAGCGRAEARLRWSSGVDFVFVPYTLK